MCLFFNFLFNIRQKFFKNKRLPIQPFEANLVFYIYENVDRKRAFSYIEPTIKTTCNQLSPSSTAKTREHGSPKL